MDLERLFRYQEKKYWRERDIEATLRPKTLLQNQCHLAISEQGIGDEIFYLSNLDSLMSKVQKITVRVDKRLAPIFARSFPSVTFITKASLLDTNLYDAQVALGSLPKILNVEPSKDLLRRNPYLIDNSNLSKEIKNSILFKNKFTCGVSWKSSNDSIGINKSINLSKLMNILNISDCEFINLQYGDVLQDIKNTEEVTGTKVNTVDNINLFNDIDGLLSIIKSCDIVVTTSNVTAHLSGAMGKKTYLLLPYSKGRIWYWHDEDVSSWYPTVKQYFQSSDFTWDAAINKLALDLKKEIDMVKKYKIS
jgi:ADP-heptose:LPS heptosyltransferase